VNKEAKAFVEIGGEMAYFTRERRPTMNGKRMVVLVVLVVLAATAAMAQDDPGNVVEFIYPKANGPDVCIAVGGLTLSSAYRVVRAGLSGETVIVDSHVFTAAESQDGYNLFALTDSNVPVGYYDYDLYADESGEWVHKATGGAEVEADDEGQPFTCEELIDPNEYPDAGLIDEGDDDDTTADDDDDNDAAGDDGDDSGGGCGC
jgi:hypothetical protein